MTAETKGGRDESRGVGSPRSIDEAGEGGPERPCGEKGATVFRIGIGKLDGYFEIQSRVNGKIPNLEGTGATP